MKQVILDLHKENQVIEISEDTELIGLFVGRDSEVLNNKLQVLHKQPNLKSLTSIKAVVYDSSRFDLEGLLKIVKGARNTDAYLRIDVLIMSERARARAIPSLEITEDSVKGGHGATVGKLDEEQKYYLQSRGLSSAAAEEILVNGFVQELLDRVNSKSEREKLEQLVTAS